MSTAKRDPMGLLHVYASPYEHDSPIVVGDLVGLRALRDALDAAMSDSEAVAGGQAVTSPLFAQDGEGYEVIVLLRDEDWEDTAGFWRKAIAPYTERKPQMDDDLGSFMDIPRLRTQMKAHRPAPR